MSKLMNPVERKTNRFLISLSFLLLFCALSYVSTMYRVAVFGRPIAIYVGVEELQRDWHQRIMANQAQAPFQYRILGELILEGLLRLGRQAEWKEINIYIGFKAVLHLIIFALAYLFFRRCGLGTGYSLCGVFYIFFAFLASYYNEDLNYYQYLDFIFSLLAFLVILKGSDWLLVPLVGLAMFNKESAFALPFVYLANRLKPDDTNIFKRPGKFLLAVVQGLKNSPPVMLRFGVCLGLALFVYFGLRLYFGTDRAYASIPETGPGWELFKWNLAQKNFYLNWLVFFNFLLVAPWRDWRNKPVFIRRSTYVLLPFLVGGSLFFGSPEEVRLFFPLLPLLLTAALLNFGQGNLAKTAGKKL
jgi:hypothetical protein